MTNGPTSMRMWLFLKYYLDSGDTRGRRREGEGERDEVGGVREVHEELEGEMGFGYD